MVSINHEELTINRIMAVTRHLAIVEKFEGPKRKKVEAVRKYVEDNWLTDSAPTRYGFNTGVGALKNVRISRGEIEKFQELYVRSHCVGVGDPLEIETVRGAMLLQANALSKGYSGVRALIVDKLIEMLNKRIHPVVPEQGSLGASGDLAPLTHVAAAMVGEGDAEIWVGNERHQIRHLLDDSGNLRFQQNGTAVIFEPIRLQAKEAVSLTNATAFMAAIAVRLVHDVEMLLLHADIAAALSLEALMCEKDAFAPELHDLRRQSGQIATAQNIRTLINGSKRMTAEAQLAYFNSITEKQIRQRVQKTEPAESLEAIKKYKLDNEFDKNRVQDAYSLRCVPQVHGACQDAFHFVKGIVEREITAVTDNPVIFPTDNGTYSSKSGGNFHGEPLALAMDFLAIAMSEIGSISERRVFRMLSPSLSFGLPRNLTGGAPGLNSGYMLLQYTAAQLVSENKILCHPASVDSIPTSDNQEDHVSMGYTAARKALKICGNVQYLLAIEFLCAIQALHLSAGEQGTSFEIFPMGRGTARVFDFIKSYRATTSDKMGTPFQLMRDDEFLHSRIVQMLELLMSGEIVHEIDNLGLSL
ncbi:MAG TPA: aromatic amino acid ammonia-lyase [bacterium]